MIRLFGANFSLVRMVKRIEIWRGNPPKTLGTDWNHDGVSGVDDPLATNETVGTVLMASATSKNMFSE